MSNIRVLITEDDMTSAKLLDINLKRMGYDVVGVAYNGERSLEMAKEFQPDVILMDINMPGAIDGIEAAQKIRDEFGIPVIYVTANNEDTIMQRALQSNPYGYILKPYTKEHLGTIIEMSVNRHHIEKALKENQQMIRLTMQSIADGLIVADNAGKITFFNPVAANLTGFDPQEALNNELFRVYRLKKHINSPFLHFNIDSFLEFVHSDQSTGFYLYSNSGEYIPVNHSVSEVLDDKGKRQGVIITFRDITDIRTAQLELKKLNDELENRVEKRTTELRQKNALLEQEVSRRLVIEEELKKSLEKEKEINELKSRIVTTISHEFRTPMTTILSSAQLMDRNINKGGDIERLKKHTASIQKNVHALIELMNDVLLVEKLDSNKLDIELCPLPIMNFFEDMVEDVRIGIGRNHQFEFQHNVFPTEINTDKKMLKQIVGNLLSNAFKYSPSGTTVFLVVFIADNELKITVKDQGIGIPEESQKHLFDSFFRAKNVTNIEGTGVGLSILAKSLELLNGQIDVESAEGKGTTFYVRIPLVD